MARKYKKNRFLFSLNEHQGIVHTNWGPNQYIQIDKRKASTKCFAFAISQCELTLSKNNANCRQHKERNKEVALTVVHSYQRHSRNDGTWLSKTIFLFVPQITSIYGKTNRFKGRCLPFNNGASKRYVFVWGQKLYVKKQQRRFKKHFKKIAIYMLHCSPLECHFVFSIAKIIQLI